MVGTGSHRRTGFRSGGGSTGRRARRWILVGVALCLMAVIAISCGGSSKTASPTATAGPSATASPAAPSNTVWLCRPGLADNPCESDLTTTVVSADGTSTTEAAAPAKDPPIDCFYVYPTVSGQTTPNANLDIDPEEKAVAIQQASRFSQVCKVYAPMYRQFTLKAIISREGTRRRSAPWPTATCSRRGRTTSPTTTTAGGLSSSATPRGR